MRRFPSLIAVVTLLVVPLAAYAFTRNSGASAECDQYVTPITKGYGANGPYEVEQLTLPQKDYSSDVEIFLPKGVTGKVPVIFFSHAYGPNMTSPVEKLYTHIVSRGMIFVFAPYPMMSAPMDDRYNKLWNGFALAAEQLGDRMDLTRVGFVGHSFGGGATPTMAYRGIVQNGWGSRGAFMMSLAPWYTYGITNEQLAQFPKHVLNFVQVYDKDTINDHRMAIDIYNHIRTPVNLFTISRTETISGCELTTDHSVPGRSESIAVKQYVLFRPLDALTEAAFNAGSPTGRTALQTLMQRSKDSNYQPLEFQRNPQPIQPESFYTFKWSSEKNERAGGKAPSSMDEGAAENGNGEERGKLLRRGLMGKRLLGN